MYGFSPAHAAKLTEESTTFGRTLNEQERRNRQALRDEDFEKTCPKEGLPRLIAKLRYYFDASPVRLPVPPRFDIPRT